MKLNGYYIERETLMNTLAELRTKWTQAEQAVDAARDDVTRCEDVYGVTSSAAKTARECAELTDDAAITAHGKYRDAVRLVVALGVYNSYEACSHDVRKWAETHSLA